MHQIFLGWEIVVLSTHPDSLFSSLRHKRTRNSTWGVLTRHEAMRWAPQASQPEGWWAPERSPPSFRLVKPPTGDASATGALASPIGGRGRITVT